MTKPLTPKPPLHSSMRNQVTRKGVGLLTRFYTLILLVAFLGVACLPSVTAVLPAQALQDSSGNGLTLTSDTRHISRILGNNVDYESSHPELSDHAISKYSWGFRNEQVTDLLWANYSQTRITGDFSFFASFELDQVPAYAQSLIVQGHQTLEATESSQENALYAVVLMGTGAIQYTHEQGSGSNTALNTVTGLAMAGTHTLWVTRDTTLKRIVLRFDGVERINTTYTTNTNGGEITFMRLGSEGETFTGGNVVGRALDGEMFEARLWNHLVNPTVLDSIADPTNVTYQGRAEGTELGLWFFEHSCTDQGAVDAQTSFLSNLMPLVIIMFIFTTAAVKIPLWRRK